MDKEKVQFDVVKSKIPKFFKIIMRWFLTCCLFFKATDGHEAVNVVGKNGYLIIDIIAYKREITPFDLEIINGNLNRS